MKTDTLVNPTLARIDREEDRRAEHPARPGCIDVRFPVRCIRTRRRRRHHHPRPERHLPDDERRPGFSTLVPPSATIWPRSVAVSSTSPMPTTVGCQSAAAEWDPVFGEETSRLQMDPLVEGGYLDPRSSTSRIPVGPSRRSPRPTPSRPRPSDSPSGSAIGIPPWTTWKSAAIGSPSPCPSPGHRAYCSAMDRCRTFRSQLQWRRYATSRSGVPDLGPCRRLPEPSRRPRGRFRPTPRQPLDPCYHARLSPMSG